MSLSEGSGANSGTGTANDDQDDDERAGNKRALGTSENVGDERAGKKAKFKVTALTALCTSQAVCIAAVHGQNSQRNAPVSTGRC